MDASQRSAFWQLQGCVVLWGFTSILGRLITLPALALVVWRMALAALLLACLPKVWRGLHRMDAPALRRHAFAGGVIALHWLAFYSAIKLANASVAVACLAVASVFAAIIEPFVTGRRHERRELLLGVLAVPGVWLLVGGIPKEMLGGVAAGIVAAVLTATYASLNKRYWSATAEPAAVTALQLGCGTLLLLAIGLPVLGGETPLTPPGQSDLGWLLVLAIVCTIAPLLMWLRALQHVSAFTTQLSLNLEPVYAIVLAALVFREHQELTPQFYLGVVVILATVFLQPRNAPD
ncbi:MAG: EamA family transporter [Gammaproteobacteria bacterium]|nr:EamA family transporter [Gammaproteobacteria bacterium]NDF86159.1 EamA family transporter [Gammaproteobacteria bacterium]